MRTAILSFAIAFCAATMSAGFDREFLYEDARHVAHGYRTWDFEAAEPGLYAIDIVPGSGKRPVKAFLDGVQIVFTRGSVDNDAKADSEGRIRRIRWLEGGRHVFDLRIQGDSIPMIDTMESSMRGNDKAPGVRAGVSRLRNGEAGFWMEGTDPDCMARVAGEPLVVAGCMASVSRRDAEAQRRFTMEVRAAGAVIDGNRMQSAAIGDAARSESSPHLWSQTLAVSTKPVRFEYPCDREGEFCYLVRDAATGGIVEGPWDFVVTVIDGNRMPSNAIETAAAPILVDSVDCAVESAGGPHLFREGGKSEIVETPDGAYRLCGPQGVHKNYYTAEGKNKSGEWKPAGKDDPGAFGHYAFDWFGYTLKVEHPGTTHILSVRVPNDLRRVTFVAAFDRRVMRCAIWAILSGCGPASGPWSELKIPIWPNEDAIDVMVLNTDGMTKGKDMGVPLKSRRGAAAALALYECPGGLPPLEAPACGWNPARGLGWDGEQINIGPNERTTPPLPDDSAKRIWEKQKPNARHEWSDLRKSWDRTFELEAWRGGTVIAYPVLSYGMQAYQGYAQLLVKPLRDIYAGEAKDSARDPVDRDVFALMLQCAERRGVTLAADFMVNGMVQIGQEWATAVSRRYGFGGDTTGIYLSEKADGAPRTFLNATLLPNPAHPAARGNQVEFCREFGRRYGRYKSFGGIRHRFWKSWPGSIEPWFWGEDTGFDDFTVGEFCKATDIALDPVGTNETAFAERKRRIREDHGAEWNAWRSEVCLSLQKEMLAALREGAPQARFFVVNESWNPITSGQGLDRELFAGESGLGFDSDSVYLFGPRLELNALDPRFFKPFFVHRETIPPFSLCCDNTSLCAPYNLEPAALALASNRLDMIWSGGHWSLPPLDDALREFTRVFRAIPDRTDWRPAEAGPSDQADGSGAQPPTFAPVAVWWAHDGGDVLFWAVNRTDTGRKVRLRFEKEPTALEDCVSGRAIDCNRQQSNAIEAAIHLSPFMPGFYRARGAGALLFFDAPMGEEEKAAVLREWAHLEAIEPLAGDAREFVAGGGEEYCPGAGAFSRRDISLSYAEAVEPVAVAARSGDLFRLKAALADFRENHSWWYWKFGWPEGMRPVGQEAGDGDRPQPRPIREWRVAGPFGGEKIDMKKNGSTRRAYDRTFPPEEGKIDFAAEYEGAGGKSVKWRDVTLGEGERVVDMAAATPCDFRGETCVSYLCATVESPANRQVTIHWTNDWFGKIWINGREVVAKMDGAAGKYESRRTWLKKGANIILVRTMAGTGSVWYCGVAFDDGE